MEKIYMNIENDTAENILSTVKFSTDKPNVNGDWYTIDEFLNFSNSYMSIDSLFSAFLEIDGKMIEDSESLMFCKCFKISKEYIISFDKLKEIFGNRIRVFLIKKF